MVSEIVKCEVCDKKDAHKVQIGIGIIYLCNFCENPYTKGLADGFSDGKVQMNDAIMVRLKELGVYDQYKTKFG